MIQLANSPMKNVVALAANDQLPLEVVLQQCNDNEHLNPISNYAAWAMCLQGVYDSRTDKPTVDQLAGAIYQVWSAALDRPSMTNALLSIKLGSAPAFAPADVYVQVDMLYPITISMVIDTTATRASGYAQLTVTDDNGDPGQGSNELTVNARTGNTLVWTARAATGADTVQLLEFVSTGGTHLFATPSEPSKQPDGTFKGQIDKPGFEVYHFVFTINNQPQQYQWDPYIRVTQ